MGAEVWRPVYGWHGLYEVSDLGRVRSLSRPFLTPSRGLYMKPSTILKLAPSERGYLKAFLANRRIRRNRFVHRMVAEAFLGLPPGPEARFIEVNHIDANHTNNKASNLELKEGIENLDHAVQLGLHPGRLTADEVRQIRALVEVERESYIEVARAFEVDEKTVRNIINRRRWSAVEDVEGCTCFLECHHGL